VVVQTNRQSTCVLGVVAGNRFVRQSCGYRHCPEAWKLPRPVSTQTRRASETYYLKVPFLVADDGSRSTSGVQIAAVYGPDAGLRLEVARQIESRGLMESCGDRHRIHIRSHQSECLGCEIASMAQGRGRSLFLVLPSSRVGRVEI
jgi:hypothetical protein